MAYLSEQNLLSENISEIEEKSANVTTEKADALLKEIDFSFKEALKKRKRADEMDMEKQDFFSDTQARLIGALCQVAHRLPKKAEAVVNQVKNMNLLCQNTDDALLLKAIIESYSKVPMSAKQGVEVMQALVKTKNIKFHPHLVLKVIHNQILSAVQQQEEKHSSIFSTEKEKSSFLAQVESFLEKRFPLQTKVSNKALVMGIIDKMKKLQGCPKEAEYPLENQLRDKERFCVVGSPKGPVTYYGNGKVTISEDGINVVVTSKGNTFIREADTRSRRHSYPYPAAERGIKKGR